MFDRRQPTLESVDRPLHGRKLRPPPGPLCAAILLLGAAPALAQDPPDLPPEYVEPQAGIENGSYGFIRIVDGTVTLLQAGGERVRAQANEPLLVGDQVWVAVGSHAELMLADRNIVRLDGGAELALEALAHSADRNDPGTVLDLKRGTIQMMVAEDHIGSELPSVRTPNASIVLRDPGEYLVIVQESSTTTLVVRQGTAEARSASDAAEVRGGEELRVSGSDGAMRFAQARGLVALERWAQGESAGGEYVEHVDDDLQYAASSLNRYGSWVLVGSRHAWRPYGVSVSWRPYWHGRWRWTPSGLFWVSYEPWGWVPYHYGSWDFVAGYGWVWFPGYRFAPAHVYWYWGPRFAGWIPHGYYWRHYRRYYGSGFHWYRGVYGFVGGHARHFRHWTFSPLGRVGHRHQHRYIVTGVNLEKRNKRMARGILTTDTRRFTPERWRRPAELLQVATRDGRNARDLPDANPFLQRVRKLPAGLERVTVRDRSGETRTASRGGPTLKPNIESRLQERRTGIQRPGAERQTAERPGVERRAAQRPGVERRTPDLPGVERRTPAELRRPETRGRDAASRPESRSPERRVQERPEVRRPTAQERSPTVRRPAATPRSEPELRRPGTRPQDRRTVRRPNETRASSPARRRPESGRATPSVRRPILERERAATPRRPDETRTPSPTLRRPAATPRSGSTLRRPTTTPRRQPELRRPSSTPRSTPAVRRPASAPRSTPTVRRPSSGRVPSARPSSRRPSAPRPSATPRSSRRPSVSRPTVRRGSSGGTSVRRRSPSRGASRARRPSRGG